MDIKHNNIYTRLRDYEIPSSVLDEIFSNPENLSILIEAWDFLIKNKHNEDQASGELAKIISKEIKLDQSQDEEK